MLGKSQADSIRSLWAFLASFIFNMLAKKWKIPTIWKAGWYQGNLAYQNTHICKLMPGVNRRVPSFFHKKVSVQSKFEVRQGSLFLCQRYHQYASQKVENSSNLEGWLVYYGDLAYQDAHICKLMPGVNQRVQGFFFHKTVSLARVCIKMLLNLQ